MTIIENNGIRRFMGENLDFEGLVSTGVQIFCPAGPGISLEL